MSLPTRRTDEVESTPGTGIPADPELRRPTDEALLEMLSLSLEMDEHERFREACRIVVRYDLDNLAALATVFRYEKQRPFSQPANSKGHFAAGRICSGA